MRDYIHVSDLARAHVLASAHLLAGGGNLRVNLGAGRGASVHEVLAAVAEIVGRPVPAVLRPRRPGDPAILYADTRRAAALLGFAPQLSDLRTIVRTAAPFFARDLADAR